MKRMKKYPIFLPVTSLFREGQQKITAGGCRTANNTPHVPTIRKSPSFGKRGTFILVLQGSKGTSQKGEPPLDLSDPPAIFGVVQVGEIPSKSVFLTFSIVVIVAKGR